MLANDSKVDTIVFGLRHRANGARSHLDERRDSFAPTPETDATHEREAEEYAVHAFVSNGKFATSANDLPKRNTQPPNRLHLVTHAATGADPITVHDSLAPLLELLF